MNKLDHALEKVVSGKKHTIRKFLTGVVVFATTYALILPAITIESDVAEDDPGIVLGTNNQTAGEDTAEETANIENEESVSESEKELEKIIEDTEYRIVVKAEENIFPEGYTLEAEVKNEENEAELFESINNKLSDKEIDREDVFEIKIKDQDGNSVQPDGKVEVSIESEVKDYDRNPVVVFAEESDEQLGEYETEILDGITVEKNWPNENRQTLKFETDRTAFFAIAYESEEKQTQTDTVTDTYSNNDNETEEISQETAPVVITEPTADFVFFERTAGLDVNVQAPEEAFPEGTTMAVIPVNNDSIETAVADAVEGKVRKVQAVDISFIDREGNEVQPAVPIMVVITPSEAPKQAEDVSVVHVDSSGKAQAVEEIQTTEDAVVFEAESFSVYAVVYTVDFEYSVNGRIYNFSMDGGTAMSFKQLVLELGIAANDEEAESFINEVANVTFSDPSLVNVYRNSKFLLWGENDWVIQSLKPFTTEESLSVVLKDGQTFEIKVTDSQAVEVTGTLQGTTMKSLGYNVYAYLVSQNGNGEAYGVKINFVDGNFTGTIGNVPEGQYKLVLAYKANNQALPEGKWNKNNVEECICVNTDGQYIFGYSAQMPDGNITIGPDSHQVGFALEVSDVQTNISVNSIMDRAINYGIVADEVKYNVRSYTNFATKKIDISNSNDSTIYNHRADGIDVVPNIIADINNNGQPLSTQDKPANYYVTEEDKDKVSSANTEETIVRNKNEIEDRVEIMISNTLKQAEQLAEQSSIVLPQGLISVDVSPYGENATIVLDATNISGEQNGFTIVKRPGQTVVFNINGQNAAPPQNTKIKLVDENGIQVGDTYVAGDQMRNAPASDGDVWNKIIWNFPDAVSVTATNQIGGIFLVPKGDFTAANKGGGWIVARGKVTVTNEWYGFPGNDEPFKQKIVRKTFVGIDDDHIDPDYALKLWTYTNESTSGTTQDRLISTLVLKPEDDSSLIKDPTGANDQTGYMQTGTDEDGNTYFEWKTPSISVGNEHKLTEINSQSTGSESLDLIEFTGPYSVWDDTTQNYIWESRESTYTSEAEFEGIFNVSSYNDDYRQYVYVVNHYDVQKDPHNLTLTKRVTDPESLETAGQEYVFTFTLKDENGSLIEDQDISYSVNDGEQQTMQSSGGQVTINLKKDETVTLIALPYGTQYTIEEKELPLKCEVSFSGDTSDNTKGVGRLIKDRSVTATNTYSDDPGIPITAHKDLIDGILTAGQFTYRLVDNSGRVIKSATNDDNGNIAFETLIFDTDGEYDYRLYEVADLSMNDVIFDPAVYNVHLVVQGGRVRRVTYNGTNTTPLFRNRKISPDSDTLTARKVFVDADGKAIELKGGEFTFTVSGTDGITYTGINDADGIVVFKDPTGQIVDLNELEQTTTFTIGERPDSYTGTIPEGQTLTYDSNTYQAIATVDTTTVTVQLWSQTVENANNTYLTLTFIPADTSSSVYYLKPLYDPAHSEIRTDNYVTFTVPVQKNLTGTDNVAGEYDFEYGTGQYYGNHTRVGTVTIRAKGGSWGDMNNPVVIETVKVDGVELQNYTRTEKTVTLEYLDTEGHYPVFVNELVKPEEEMTEFTFSKIWRNMTGEETKVWPEDKTITVSILQSVGPTDTEPAVYAEYTIDATDAAETGMEIAATDPSLPKLKVISNSDNTYTFKLEEIPASRITESGTIEYTYYVSEQESIPGCQNPKYYLGSERQMGATKIGDHGIIANDEEGYELPSTGGSGTNPFALCGGFLIGMAAILYVYRHYQKRKQIELLSSSEEGGIGM